MKENRRGFLKKIAVGGIGISLSSHLYPAETSLDTNEYLVRNRERVKSIT